MGQTNAGRIFAVMLAASFTFGAFLVNGTECFAASGDNPIRIISPAAQAVVVDWKTLVKGELNLPASTEVGVTINGSVALVHREKFATMLLLNFPTPTTDVSATVTDSLGKILATHSIPITAKTPDGELVLTFRPFPVLGTAPRSVRFTQTIVGCARRNGSAASGLFVRNRTVRGSTASRSPMSVLECPISS